MQSIRKSAEIPAVVCGAHGRSLAAAGAVGATAVAARRSIRAIAELGRCKVYVPGRVGAEWDHTLEEDGAAAGARAAGGPSELTFRKLAGTRPGRSLRPDQLESQSRERAFS